jgi:hypothetical protein
VAISIEVYARVEQERELEVCGGRVRWNLRAWHSRGHPFISKGEGKDRVENRVANFSMDPLSILNFVGFACCFTLPFDRSTLIATSNYSRLTSVLKFMCSINLFFSV